MAKIDAKQVKALREQTGIGMMECKRALEAANGDSEQALIALRAASGVKAAKRASRIGAEGLIVGAVNQKKGRGVLLQLSCETDFVARSEDFRIFGQRVAEQALAQSEQVAAADLLRQIQQEVEEARQQLVQKIGENIQVNGIETASGGTIGLYVHTTGKIGALAVLQGGDEALAQTIAMQVTADNPAAISADSLPSELMERERVIYEKEARDSGRPPEIQEKMISGKLRKFASEMCLVDRAVIAEPDRKIADLLKDAQAEVVSFARLQLSAAAN